MVLVLGRRVDISSFNLAPSDLTVIGFEYNLWQRASITALEFVPPVYF